MVATLQSHMIPVPKAFLVLKIFQLVFSTIITAICIYGAIYAAVGGVVLNIVTGLISISYIIYYLVSTYSQTASYQYWAIISLEIFCLIFWLISFAALAAEVAVAASYVCGSYYYYGVYYSDPCTQRDIGAIGLFGACAGVGALNFIFFIATLSVFGVYLGRHRRNGGHCNPGSPEAGTAPVQSYGLEKVAPQATVQPYPAAPAPVQVPAQAQGGYYPPANNDPRYSQTPVQGGQQYPQQVPVQGQQYNPPVQYAQQPPQ